LPLYSPSHQSPDFSRMLITVSFVKLMVSGVVDWKSYKATTWSITELDDSCVCDCDCLMPFELDDVDFTTPFSFALALLGVVATALGVDAVDVGELACVLPLLLLVLFGVLCLSFFVVDDTVVDVDVGGGVDIIVVCLFERFAEEFIL
jgi:hypothetical protein